MLKEIGFDFTIASPDIDESFPPHMPVEEIPVFLARKKAGVIADKAANAVVIASDTIVLLGETVLNKPADRREAIDMLRALSGKTHRVITAVCLRSPAKTTCFDDRTDVTFRKLTDQQIEHYIDRYKPYDKAGAYGAQDCLPPGLNPCSAEEIAFLKKINKTDLIRKSLSSEAPDVVIIDKISGSYFTVMGLPIHKLHAHLVQLQ